MLLKLINQIPEGYSQALYQGERYRVHKETLTVGRSIKVFAQSLQGNDFISFNYYLLSSKELLKPCEMPEQKVLHFMQHMIIQ